MADLTITAANVLAQAGAEQHDGIAGATIAQGKAVAIDPTTGKIVLADSNHATAALRRARGVALNAASDGQPIKWAGAGPVAIGATLTAGVAYYLSDTPGGICPVADVGSGENSVLLGLATSASVLDLDIQNSGVTL